jgi:hypothetical protein
VPASLVVAGLLVLPASAFGLAWSPPVTLEQVDGSDGQAALVADDAGDAALAWNRTVLANQTLTSTVAVSSRPAGRAFGPPQDLFTNAPDQAIEGPVLATNARGDAAVAWAADNDLGMGQQPEAAERQLAHAGERLGVHVSSSMAMVSFGRGATVCSTARPRLKRPPPWCSG